MRPIRPRHTRGSLGLSGTLVVTGSVAKGVLGTLRTLGSCGDLWCLDEEESVVVSEDGKVLRQTTLTVLEVSTPSSQSPGFFRSEYSFSRSVGLLFLQTPSLLVLGLPKDLTVC